MARFRKSIKVAPGVKLNISKSGVSGTFGVKGASVNVGKDGTYLNTGIPGTGIYDRKKIGGGADSAGAAPDEAGAEGLFIENSTDEQKAAFDKVIGFLFLGVFVIDIVLSIIFGWFKILNIIFLVIIFFIGLGCFAPKAKKQGADEAGVGEQSPEKPERNQ